MIVTAENFEHVLADLWLCKCVSVDTEGTGLRPYHGDEPFSIILEGSGCLNAYYFNFRDYGNGEPCLGEAHIEALREFFKQEKTWVFHNAKYDMAMLKEKFDIEFGGRIHCTMVTERVINDQINVGDFSLDSTARRYGYEKSKAVENYIRDNGLTTTVAVPGKKTREERPHFEKVTFEIIVPYGCKDASITGAIFKRQRERLVELDRRSVSGQPSVLHVYENESRLVRTVYEIERRGVRIDRSYCHSAIEAEEKEMKEAESFWRSETGMAFKTSGKVYQQVFASEKHKWKYTAKKNPSFTAEILETFDSPLAKAVCAYNTAKANINYYLGFLYHADSNDIIHANLNQHAARTGRFSSSHPNLQNMKKDDESSLGNAFIVRRAIVPRKEGNFLGMIDYDQVEYRMMLDYAGAMGLIKKILEEGLDVHQATAVSAGLKRSQAKGVNFGILYGMGDQALADSLKSPLAYAKEVKQKIFNAAPEVERFIQRVKDRALHRGYIWNWLGRINRYNRDTVFKAPNGLIQGGAADVIKIAMNKCETFLKYHETKLILCIHDELVFEGPREELPVLLELKKIMEGVYPHTHLPLTAGVDVSFRSLADKIPYDEAVKL